MNDATTIDSTPSVPPPKGSDPDYLTRDIEAALHRAVIARVDATAKAAGGIGRRLAALEVLAWLEGR